MNETTVYLGNTAPINAVKPDPSTTDVDRIPLEYDNGRADNNAVTVLRVPGDVKLAEALITVTGVYASHHSDDPPEWVESSNRNLAALLADHYTTVEQVDPDTGEVLIAEHECVVGRPAGWKGEGLDALPPVDAPPETRFGPEARGGGNAPVSRGGGEPSFVDDYILDQRIHVQRVEPRNPWAGEELRVDSGKDFQSRVMGDTASTGTGSYAAANFIGLSTSATAPAAGDTVTTWEAVELQAASGGLNRAQATYAHTAGASTYTLTKAFTANANDGASNTIQKIGVLNAARPGGSLVFETALSSPPALVAGDQLTITETVTI